LYSSADVGRRRSEIIADPISDGWDYSLITTEQWWYEYNETRDEEYIDFRKGHFHHQAEMKHVFADRMHRLKQFIFVQNDERSGIV
jgi:hypothetical protein